MQFSTWLEGVVALELWWGFWQPFSAGMKSVWWTFFIMWTVCGLLTVLVGGIWRFGRKYATRNQSGTLSPSDTAARPSFLEGLPWVKGRASAPNVAGKESL